MKAPASRVGAPRKAVGAPRPRVERGQSWNLGRLAFSLLPLAGSERRKTLETAIVPGRVWTHDQIQGVVNVNVPVRQTVVKCGSGADSYLWVHNPVAPTAECVQMVRDLEAKHGPVRHVVLGTLGLEHKALAGPFAKSFPAATVWLQPGQWSFPLPIPPPLLGFPGGPKLKTLGEEADEPEWASEIEYETLGPLRFKAVGAFGETAFFHKSSATLLLTDTIVRVDDSPPPIIEEDPRALLFHARDEIGEEVSDTRQSREKGWRRICLFGLIFFPSSIEVRLASALNDLRRLPKSMRSLGQGAVPLGLYPWEWARSEQPSFEALQGGLLCAPILQSLILNRFPDETLAWVDRVSTRWQFTRIVPCHLANDLRAGPRDFSAAFDFLRAKETETEPQLAAGAAAAESAEPEPARGLLGRLGQRFFGFSALRRPRRAPEPLTEDLKLLSTASELCTRFGLVEEPKV